MVIIKGSKMFKCSMCTRAFTTSTKLNVHFMGHMDRQITCPKCDKQFLKTDHLKKHLNSHDGKRDFICEKCNKGFLTKYHLTRHLKICKGPKIDSRHSQQSDESTSHYGNGR
uniref:C2H2-type domain-containing protein n=1 Tax=Cyprinus carpio TaxID=7962 RepID=A0A8C1NJE4_CYPCA